MANNKEDLKEMMRKLRKYITERGLEMNPKKSKVMRGIKGGRKKKKLPLHGWEMKFKK